MSNELKNSGQRGNWSSKFGFLMVTIGSAVGLGNIWRFPYLAGSNGGSAFLFIYVIGMVFLGLPLLLSEINLGIMGRTDAYGTFKKIDRRLAFFGILGVITSFLIISYYNVIGGTILKYFTTYAAAIFGAAAINASTAADFFTSVSSSPSTLLFWLLVYNLIIVLIVYKGIESGTESANKFMMPALFILLTIVAVRSLTLPNVGEGISFLLKPKFSDVTFTTFTLAMGQVFFSLSLGMGAMLTYGSYLNKEHAQKRNYIIVCLANTLVAVLAGLAIIPAVFSAGYAPSQGPGLMFITLPSVFDNMTGGNFIGAIFFLLIAFAALSSSIALMEVVIAFFTDQLKLSRHKSIIIIALLMTAASLLPLLSFGTNAPLAHFSIASLLGNPEWVSGKTLFTGNFFDIADFIASNLFLPVGGMALSLAIGWIIKSKRWHEIVTFDNSETFPFYKTYFFIIKYAAPLIILIILLEALGFI
jgi:NSS family neurotransmitter:Na+ symporter